jgi:hypothetical protein
LLLRLTLDRFPVAVGVGVAGASAKMLEAVLAPSGLVEPNDDVRPPPTALCSNGLSVDGEYCGAFSFDGEVLNRGDEYCPEPGLARGELL